MKNSSFYSPTPAQCCLGLFLAVCSVAAAEGQTNAVRDTVRFFQDSPRPQAVVLSVSGRATSSTDGDRFKTVRTGDLLNEGAVIRTEANSVTDLFFRRLAITVRLTAGTELKLEKMRKSIKEGLPIMDTSLDLRKGRIFCFVRSVIPGSKFEVRHAGGRSIVEGEGMGGYDIDAEGAAVTGNATFIPLKVVSETGVAVVAPGEKFNPKNKTVMQLAPTEKELTFMQLDELRALAETLSPVEDAPK